MPTPKNVVISAGTVYGRLDSNKLVGNRIRGIWASQFADKLANLKRFHVTLVVSDIQRKQIESGLRYRDFIRIVEHHGFDQYRAQIEHLAGHADAMLLAGAVVNWIPAEPWIGKMPTEGFKEGDTIQIPFKLAPRVIDQVKLLNPKCTLIGCKMTVGADDDHLIEAAYKTLLGARCAAVVANDLINLKRKLVVHRDRAVLPFQLVDDRAFYQHLIDLIEDEYWQTAGCGSSWTTELHEYTAARRSFDRIVDRYRDRFVKRINGEDKVFGAVAVRLDGGALMSPREKGQAFTAEDAVDVAPLTPDDVNQHTLYTVGGRKATLNAPLLLRHLVQWPKAGAVLHLHEQLPGEPTVPYAPPGTTRDNLREIVAPVYNIEHHGCIAAVDAEGNLLHRGGY